MSHGFTKRLRRFGAGAAAILLVAGASACGGTAERDSASAEEGKGALGALGGSGGNRSSERETDRDRERGGSSERNGGERSSENSSGTARIGGAQQEQAGPDNFDRRVRIVNNSEQTITFLYGSPSNVNEWGQDRIPTLTLAAGMSTIVDFDDSNGECRYDLKAQFSDGTSREQRGINICQVSEWTVTSGGSSAR